MSSDTVHEVRDDRGCQILTVGALREMLKNVDDMTQVVVSTTDWYTNVETVIIPGPNPETAEFMAVTLFPGEEIDSRQF